MFGRRICQKSPLRRHAVFDQRHFVDWQRVLWYSLLQRHFASSKTLCRLAKCLGFLFYRDILIEEPPPPGGVLLLAFLNTKKQDQEDPLKNNPNFKKKLGLFLKEGPLPPGCWFETHPTKKSPWGGGVSYDQLAEDTLWHSLLQRLFVCWYSLLQRHFAEQ